MAKKKFNIEDRVKAVFKANEGLKEVYVTSDEQIFIKKNLAENHAWREHGKLREKKLKLVTVTPADVGIETKTDEPIKENLQAEYDELFEKNEAAKTVLANKREKLDKATKDAETAKGTDVETEKNELLKKATTSFKTAETKAGNLTEALKEAETAIEEFEA